MKDEESVMRIRKEYYMGLMNEENEREREKKGEGRGETEPGSGEY